MTPATTDLNIDVKVQVDALSISPGDVVVLKVDQSPDVGWEFGEAVSRHLLENGQRNMVVQISPDESVETLSADDAATFVREYVKAHPEVLDS